MRIAFVSLPGGTRARACSADHVSGSDPDRGNGRHREFCCTRRRSLERQRRINSLESALYYQTINLTERARTAGQVRIAEQLLLDCKLSLRGWEWEYLHRLRYGQMPAIDHASHLFSLAVSGDGKFIAVGGSDGTVTIRESQRLGKVRVLQAHASSWARSVAFSPDSQRLVTGGWDRRVRVWEVNNGEMVWQANAEDNVQCVAFHPDGQSIASSGVPGIQFWNAQTGAKTSTITNPDNLFVLTFSRDGRLLAGAADGSAAIRRRWTTAWSIICPLVRASPWPIVQPDGRLLAAASGALHEGTTRA